MVKVSIRYEGGLRCAATHGPSGQNVFTDAPVDNHGRGESFSPTDLVATALGGCMATIMGMMPSLLERVVGLFYWAMVFTISPMAF